jgi:hypothetical protein
VRTWSRSSSRTWRRSNAYWSGGRRRRWNANESSTWRRSRSGRGRTRQWGSTRRRGSILRLRVWYKRRRESTWSKLS